MLYLLMRGNFEFTNRKAITRVHLQVRSGGGGQASRATLFTANLALRGRLGRCMSSLYFTPNKVLTQPNCWKAYVIFRHFLITARATNHL